MKQSRGRGKLKSVHLDPSAIEPGLDEPKLIAEIVGIGLCQLCAKLLGLLLRRSGLGNLTKPAQRHRQVVKRQPEMPLEFRIGRLRLQDLAAQVDGLDVIGPRRRQLSGKLPDIAQLPVARRQQVASLAVAGILGTRALGQVLHLQEPDLRLLEIVVEAESPAQPEVGLQQGTPRLAAVGTELGGRLGQNDHPPQMFHGLTGLPGSQTQLAEPGERLSQTVGDRQVVGRRGREALGQQPGKVVLLESVGRAADLAEHVAQQLMSDGPAGARRGGLGAVGNLVQARDCLVEQGLPQGAGRRGLAQLLLDVKDKLIQCLQGQVALCDGRLLGRLGLVARRRGDACCNTRRRRA